MRHYTSMALACLLLGGLPFNAAADMLIRDMPDNGTVALSGIIDQVKSDKEFILRDTSGTIDVTIASGQSLVLKPGEKVNVVGAVNKGVLGIGERNVRASAVNVQKDLGTTLGNAVAANTGVSIDQAKTSQVSELPKQGMVRLLGTVESVSDAKSFTLKDASGSVKVKIQSDEAVALKKGAEVTVIGYVEDGLISKTIRATRVIMSDNSLPGSGIGGT